MKLSSSNIKKFVIFSQKKAFLIFGDMELSKFWKTETLKKFFIFQETSYISESNFLSSKIKQIHC